MLSPKQVPAGSYFISFRISLQNTRSSPQTASCTLSTGDSATIRLDDEGDGDQGVLVLQDVATFSVPTTITVHCIGFEIFTQGRIVHDRSQGWLYPVGSLGAWARRLPACWHSNCVSSGRVGQAGSLQYPVMQMSRSTQPSAAACFESAFPNGRDESISAAATNWASMALALASRKPKSRRTGEAKSNIPANRVLTSLMTPCSTRGWSDY